MSHLRGTHILLIGILLVVTSSCALPASSPPAEPTQIPTNPPPAPTSTLNPTVAPTLAPSPLPTTAEAPTPSGTHLYLPVGLAVATAGDKVAYYDLQGQLLGDIQTPNLGTGSLQQSHIAGPLTLSPSPILPPLVYYAFANGGELWLNENNNLSLIKATPNLYSLIGVPGKPTVVYSLVEYSDVGIRSMVYLGDSQTLPSASAIMDSTNSQSYAVEPLAISIKDNNPTGIWYTTVPYGIGGDIVFEPRTAVHYLDLSTYDTQDFLDLTKCPAGISDDQTWLAYTPSGGIGPMSIVHNLGFSSVVTFPQKEDSDRGSGNAVFSQDDQLVAWREAGGSLTDQPPSFRQTIRIARVDGNIVSEILDTSLSNITGYSDIGWVVPVGWIDTQTLALEVINTSGTNSSIVKVNSDGSGLALLAPGSFVGFLYP